MFGAEAVERATDGRSLYEATRSLSQAFPMSSSWLIDPPYPKEWDELPWDEKDSWEAKADELNESRRGTP